MNDHQRIHRRILRVEGDRIDVEQKVADMNKLSRCAIRRDGTRRYRRPGGKPVGKTWRDCNWEALFVINGCAICVLKAVEAFHGALYLTGRATFDIRLQIAGQAVRRFLGMPF